MTLHTNVRPKWLCQYFWFAIYDSTPKLGDYDRNGEGFVAADAKRRKETHSVFGYSSSERVSFVLGARCDCEELRTQRHWDGEGALNKMK